MIWRWNMPILAILALSKTFWAKIRGFRVLCTPEEEEKRWEECEICDFRSDDDQCLACGCMIRAKIVLCTEKCPKNHWDAIWAKKVRQNDTK